MARADLEVVMARPVQTGRAPQRTIRVDTFDGATTIEFSTRGEILPLDSDRRNAVRLRRYDVICEFD